MERPPVLPVLSQHVDELASLWDTRRVLVDSPHVALRQLGRIDARIAAHQDGCCVAGSAGEAELDRRLVKQDPGFVFARAVVGVDGGRKVTLDRSLAAADAVPGSAVAILSALGWVERDRLAGIGKDLLTSESPFRRALGLAACRVHGVDAGPALLAGLKDLSPLVRAEALRTAGTVGRHELVSTLGAWTDEDPECQFWASWSAVLMGDRHAALDQLTHIGLAPGRRRGRALRLALQAMSAADAHATLQSLAGKPDDRRWLIRGSGIVGDPSYVPWLIQHMSDDQTARIAGEAFSLITGTDLAWLDLERQPPDDFESGPNDDPDDPDVSLDPDDGLPWPDPRRIQAWWDAQGGRFESGARYFMGAAVTDEQCLDVLRHGYQRQRRLAAHYRCLLAPGTPLFNTSAPAARQRRQLASLPGADRPSAFAR